MTEKKELLNLYRVLASWRPETDRDLIEGYGGEAGWRRRLEELEKEILERMQ